MPLRDEQFRIISAQHARGMLHQYLAEIGNQRNNNEPALEHLPDILPLEMPAHRRIDNPTNQAQRERRVHVALGLNTRLQEIFPELNVSPETHNEEAPSRKRPAAGG